MTEEFKYQNGLLKNNVDHLKQENSKLQDNVQKMSQNINLLENENKKFHDEVSKFKHENEKLVKNIHELQQQTQKFETQNENLAENVENFQHQTKKFEENIAKRGLVGAAKTRDDSPNVSSLMMGILLVIVVGSVFMQIFRGQ